MTIVKRPFLSSDPLDSTTVTPDNTMMKEFAVL